MDIKQYYNMILAFNVTQFGDVTQLQANQRPNKLCYIYISYNLFYTYSSKSKVEVDVSIHCYNWLDISKHNDFNNKFMRFYPLIIRLTNWTIILGQNNYFNIVL